VPRKGKEPEEEEERRRKREIEEEEEGEEGEEEYEKRFNAPNNISKTFSRTSTHPYLPTILAALFSPPSLLPRLFSPRLFSPVSSYHVVASGEFLQEGERPRKTMHTAKQTH
jgi:hypothetical protein